MWEERLSKISCCCPLTNGAPTTNAPLVIQVTNGAPPGGAPLVVLQKKHTNGASTGGAPLLVVTSNGAPARRCATNVIFFIIVFILFCAKVLMAHHQGVRH